MRVGEIDMVSEAARSFREKGYSVVDAFSAAEAAGYREKILDLQARAGEEGKGDRWSLEHGVSITPVPLWSLITHERILAAVRDALQTCDVRYAEHSEVEVWRGCAHGGERDSTGERAVAEGAWRPEYRVVRVACYFQGASEGFEWGAIVGSHRADPKPRPWTRRLGRRRHAANVTWLETEPTECILFDPRLIHIREPAAGATTVAAFLAFGVNNDYTLHHRKCFGCEDNPYRLALSGYLDERGLA
jgi:hypothetical protein